MAICEKSGHSNDDNVKFCGGCGARMDVRHLLGTLSARLRPQGILG